MYSQQIMDIFLNPKNLGKLRGANGIGQSNDELNSVIVRVYIKVEEERIIKAQAEVFGNPDLIACADFMCELINGKPLDYALSIKEEDLISGLPDYIAKICVQAIKFAVIDYKDRLYKQSIKLKKSKRTLENIENFKSILKKQL
ncbi:MAG: iron-sulfur cluster assembly scaffold protein [Clostridia bacterium]|jgi:nitrogen fixation NifU-like protein|nr:iron-sulfur cluster assembly scaffold protein [Clostridia bacterium]